MTTRDPRRADPQDWCDSRDIETAPGHWMPRYLRCSDARCLRLVTVGQMRLGGCTCGTARLVPAGRLSLDERLGLALDRYVLSADERALIHPWTLRSLLRALIQSVA